MKSLILLTLLIFVVACKKTATTNSYSSIIGKWQLSEYLIDPGDGSGVWQPSMASNPGYLEFKADGSLDVSPLSVNNWDHYQVTSDSTIVFFRNSEQFVRGFQLTKTLLTLTGGCYETCGQRYIPVLQ